MTATVITQPQDQIASVLPTTDRAVWSCGRGSSHPGRPTQSPISLLQRGDGHTNPSPAGHGGWQALSYPTCKTTAGRRDQRVAAGPFRCACPLDTGPNAARLGLAPSPAAHPLAIDPTDPFARPSFYASQRGDESGEFVSIMRRVTQGPPGHTIQKLDSSHVPPGTAPRPVSVKGDVREMEIKEGVAQRVIDELRFEANNAEWSLADVELAGALRLHDELSTEARAVIAELGYDACGVVVFEAFQRLGLDTDEPEESE